MRILLMIYAFLECVEEDLKKIMRKLISFFSKYLTKEEIKYYNNKLNSL